MTGTCRSFFMILGLMFLASVFASAQNPDRPAEWKAWEEKNDKLNIRLTGKMYTDSSPDFLAVPADYPDLRDFEVAKTPPTVDFGIVKWYE
ncbi:MAG: hypothetical protein ACYC9O_11680, partial [Candidatus Latescibacterota bacterium]